MIFQPAIFNQSHQAEEIRLIVRQFMKHVQMERKYQAMICKAELEER